MESPRMEFEYMIGIWVGLQNRRTIFFEENWKFILIIRTVICILTLVNSTLFAFVILKNKKLETTKNFIMLNFAFVTLLYSIVSTLDVVVDKYYFYSSMQVKTVMNLLLQLSFIQATLVAVDWCFLKSFPHLANGYQRNFKLVMGLSYCMPLLYIIPFFIAGYHWFTLISNFSYIICFVGGIITITINIIRLKVENALRKYSDGVWLANVYFLMWMVPMSVLFWAAFVRSSSTAYFVYYCLHLVGLLGSLLTLLVLIRRDEELIKSYAAIFGKSSSDLPPENTTNCENVMVPILKP